MVSILIVTSDYKDELKNRVNFFRSVNDKLCELYDKERINKVLSGLE